MIHLRVGFRNYYRMNKQSLDLIEKVFTDTTYAQNLTKQA
jgi:hypothetical protein